METHCSICTANTDSQWDAALALLHSVFVGEGFTDPQAAQNLFKRGHIQGHGDLLIAVADDGAILGGTVLVAERSPLSQIAKAGEREFRLLGVAEHARGNGIGRRLVEECLRRAAASGAERMVLSTQPSMLEAHRLYEALGFIRTPERDWRRASGREMWVYAIELT